MIKEFADVIITDITAGQRNHFFAEIVPHTLYPLYCTAYSFFTGLVNTTTSYIEVESGNGEEPENGVIKVYQN